LTARRVAVGAALVLLALFPLAGATFYTELVTKVMVLAIFALSLDLLVGYTGLVSFGHAAFYGIGAYTLALLTPKYEAASLWLTLPAAGLAAALAALATGALVVRVQGIYFIMVTLAFAQMFYFVFHDTKFGRGSDGITMNFKPVAAIGGVTVIDLGNATHLYYFVFVSLVATFTLLRLCCALRSAAR
jgi:branched-chain amino acid transport system permease protein